jgi:hypothetical protein
MQFFVVSGLTFERVAAATKKAAQWGELDKKMEAEMLSSTKELQQCVVAINRDIQTIADNPISKDAKKSLLLAAKSLMQRTVRVSCPGAPRTPPLPPCR